MLRQPLRIITQPINANVYSKMFTQQTYSTKSICKLKGDAVQRLANDGTGKHSHIVENFCTLDNCETKKCSNLCDNPNGLRITGHNTHKPPIGRMTRYIAPEDADGKNKTQYFVTTNKKIQLTEEERLQYEKNIKPKLKQQQFLEDHTDKYD